MAEQYDNERRGVLFRVKKKTNAQGPDYWGRLQIEGVSYRIAAWVNTSERGTKYFSLRASEEDDEHKQRSKPADDGQDDMLDPSPPPPPAEAAAKPKKGSAKSRSQAPVDEEIPF